MKYQLREVSLNPLDNKRGLLHFNCFVFAKYSTILSRGQIFLRRTSLGAYFEGGLFGGAKIPDFTSFSDW